MRASIAICLAVLAATPAAAENWVRVGGDDGAGEYVDSDSVERAGDEVRFSFEVRFAAPRPEGFDRWAFAHAASCRDRSASALAMRFFMDGREVMASTFREDEADRETVAADTPIGRALAYLCEGAREPDREAATMSPRGEPLTLRDAARSLPR